MASSGWSSSHSATLAGPSWDGHHRGSCARSRVHQHAKLFSRWNRNGKKLCRAGVWTPWAQSAGIVVEAKIKMHFSKIVSQVCGMALPKPLMPIRQRPPSRLFRLVVLSSPDKGKNSNHSLSRALQKTCWHRLELVRSPYGPDDCYCACADNYEDCEPWQVLIPKARWRDKKKSGR